MLCTDTRRPKARITVSWCRMSTGISTSSLNTNDKRGFAASSLSEGSQQLEVAEIRRTLRERATNNIIGTASWEM
jgi:hypothetical protein